MYKGYAIDINVHIICYKIVEKPKTKKKKWTVDEPNQIPNQSEKISENIGRFAYKMLFFTRQQST